MAQLARIIAMFMLSLRPPGCQGMDWELGKMLYGRFQVGHLQSPRRIALLLSYTVSRQQHGCSSTRHREISSRGRSRKTAVLAKCFAVKAIVHPLGSALNARRGSRLHLADGYTNLSGCLLLSSIMFLLLKIHVDVGFRSQLATTVPKRSLFCMASRCQASPTIASLALCWHPDFGR